MSDLINRNDVYKLFEHGVAKLHVSDIDAISTVDAEPVVHGHWLAPYDDQDNWMCSICGTEEAIPDEVDNPIIYGLNYCSHCGARMDKKVSE